MLDDLMDAAYGRIRYLFLIIDSTPLLETY